MLKDFAVVDVRSDDFVVSLVGGAVYPAVESDACVAVRLWGLLLDVGKVAIAGEACQRAKWSGTGPERHSISGWTREIVGNQARRGKGAVDLQSHCRF